MSNAIVSPTIKGATLVRYAFSRIVRNVAGEIWLLVVPVQMNGDR